MHTTAKAVHGKITVAVPAEWEGHELHVEIVPVVASESLFEALDRVLEGERIDTTRWKFNREELHDRKSIR